MEQQESKGALIGSIIIVALLIAGGIYFAREAKESISSSQLEVVLEEDAELREIEESQTSDDLAEIDGSLDTVDFGGLDAEFDSSTR